jgi:hypothetical protein
MLQTGEKVLLEESVYGIACYNPKYQTLFYAKDVSSSSSEHRIMQIVAKNLKTGKVTEVYTDTLVGWYALFFFADNKFYCQIHRMFDDDRIKPFEISEDLKPGAELEPVPEIKLAGNLILKSGENSTKRALYALDGKKETLLSESVDSYSICNGYLYYINSGYNRETDTRFSELFRVKLDGSEQKLLRKDTHLTNIFTAANTLYGLADYDDAYPHPDEFETILHALDADGKPTASLHKMPRSQGDDGGVAADVVGDLIFLSIGGFESSALYYAGMYDARTKKFYAAAQ